MIHELRSIAPHIPELIKLSIPETLKYDAPAIAYEAQSLEKFCNRIINSYSLNLDFIEFRFDTAAKLVRNEILFLQKEFKSLKKGRNAVLLIAVLKILSALQPATTEIHLTQTIQTINLINNHYENNH